MPQSTDAKQLKKAIESLVSQHDALVEERDAIHQKFNTLSAQIAELNGAIERLVIMYRMLHGNWPLESKYKPTVPIFPKRPVFGPNAKIGDAMEAILSEAKKPLTKDEIVEKLRESGVGISLNNPKIVLAIAIKRDKEQRFASLADGRVALKARK